MTPWPTKVKQVGGYLLNVKQFYLILSLRKPSRGPDAYPKNCEMQNFVPIISLPESNAALLKISPAQTLTPENLFSDAETFSSCSFVPRRNLNVSAVSLLHLKLPWQQNFDMQLKSNFGFF